MVTLQFQPLISQPTPDFWSAVTSLKLDKLRLDDSVIPIHAWVEEGRHVVNTNKLTGKVDGQNVGVDGGVVLSASAFQDSASRPSPSATLMRGIFKNFNTIEQFRSPQAKKEVFDSMVDKMLESFTTAEPQLDVFVLFTFADLKKYTYHYWFAFPALVSKPMWQLEESFTSLPEQETVEIRHLVDRASNLSSAYLLKGVAGQRQLAALSQASTFFDAVPTEERFLVFHDPSSLPNNPGWTLRNCLYYLQARHGIQSINVVCLRQGQSSRLGRVSTTGPASDHPSKPQAVGWERDGTGKLASKVANLGPMLDPTRLAEQAVDLNLKLMRWRIMPNLDLDKVASTKCLLLGAGTLGCYVARALMGWGVRTITFVDSARVSYSNPVRQPLFQFADCLNGGKPKAACASERLKEIFPSINSSAHAFTIPMPGHPVGSGSTEEVASHIAKLEQLIQQHDAVFLLMDSRESRWLPTVIAASEGKVVINAALGFDSYLVMRHGPSPSDHVTRRLGCYFCNDIVAPTDSLTDRTLDQMCTVTRPGVAPMAAAVAVELLVSLIQHPLGILAPAERAASVVDSAKDKSPLGLVPHQLRGMLSHWSTALVEGAAYDRCTACSFKIVDAYRKGGLAFMLRVFNETGFLESITGLDKLYAEAEAVLDSVDWEEGSGSGDDF